MPGGGCLNFSYAWWRQNNNLLWLEEPSEFICAWWRLIHYLNKCLVEAYGCVWFLNNAMPGGGYIHNFKDGLVEAYECGHFLKRKKLNCWGIRFSFFLWWNVNNILYFSKTEIKLQAMLEKEKKLQQEAFWLETVTFGKNLRDDKWFNLFDIKAAMDKILFMAMENDIDNETVAQWKKDVVLVQVLMEGLKNKPHQEAIRTLKIKFGGSRGLDDDSRRMVNRIMRDSQRVQNIDSFPPQTWQPNPFPSLE